MSKLKNLVYLNNVTQKGGNRVKSSIEIKYLKKFNELLNFTMSELSKSIIINNVFNILLHLNNMVTNNNIDTIVIIGDSPAIFGKLYKSFIMKFMIFKFLPKKLYNLRDLLEKLEIKFMPLSRLANFNSKDNIENLNNKISDIKDKLNGKILWVDYINSGFSFLNFYDSLPVAIKKRSYYYLYGTHGFSKSEFTELRDKLIKKKKMYYYNVIYYSIFGIFLARTLGNSERHETRCVEYVDSVDLDKIVMYDVNDVPTKKLNKYMKKSYCSGIAFILEKLMFSEGYDFKRIFQINVRI